MSGGSEKSGTNNLKKLGGLLITQSGAKVGLQLSMWKIKQ